MKRLIAFVCVIVLMSTLAVSAMAAGSPGEVVVPVVITPVNPPKAPAAETKTTTGGGAGTAAATVATAPADEWELVIEEKAVTNSVWFSEKIAETVDTVNNANADESLSLKELFQTLADMENNNVTMENGVATIKNDDSTETTIDLSTEDAADLASGFSAVYYKNSTSRLYADEPIELEIQYEQLKGRNAEDFQLLVIAPFTGNTALVDLDPAKLDAETGTITVTLPFMGVFALIEK
jgi:hypothetical protein